MQQSDPFFGLSINMINMNSTVSEDLFHSIVVEHSDRIYNLALMKSNQAALAEDICQETFMRVYKGLANFRSESQLGTWIYRIALNVCNTMIKKESLLSGPVIPLDERPDLEPQGEDGNVEDIFFKDVRGEEVRRAISALPSLQSDAITLYYLQEFQYSEVAEVMDVPLNTVKSHIRRAKQNLRKLLMEVYDET